MTGVSHASRSFGLHLQPLHYTAWCPHGPRAPQSVGTKVSQAEHQLFGQASHVTHCCRMCFQSSGYRFRRWLHIDGSCCPVWKDHEVLWSQRRRVTVGSEPEWLIIGPFSSVPGIPGCCPSPKAAPRSSPAFPRPVAVAVELSSAHQPELHMNPAEVSWCVCLTFELSSRRAYCANAASAAELCNKSEGWLTASIFTRFIIESILLGGETQRCSKGIGFRGVRSTVRVNLM